MAGSLICFYFFTKGVAIHFRHHNIADDEVWYFSAGCIPSQFPVFGCYNIKSLSKRILYQLP